jgi:hypothetical protein
MSESGLLDKHMPIIHRLPQLSCLMIGNSSELNDITFLHTFTDLRTLDIACKNLTNLVLISRLTTLGLYGVEFLVDDDASGVDAIAQLVSLTKLVSFTTFADHFARLSTLVNLHVMEGITLMDAGRGNVPLQLSAFKRLEVLGLCIANIWQGLLNDLDHLQQANALTSLTRMHLETPGFFSGIHSLTTLKSLDIRSEDTFDVAVVSRLVHLTALYVDARDLLPDRCTVSLSGLLALQEFGYAQTFGGSSISLPELPQLTFLSLCSQDPPNWSSDDWERLRGLRRLHLRCRRDIQAGTLSYIHQLTCLTSLEVSAVEKANSQIIYTLTSLTRLQAVKYRAYEYTHGWTGVC